jgi:PBSX family phage terminase large subunit
MPLCKTPDQKAAINLMGNPNVTRLLLYGGSRSGKSFIIIYALIVRALRVANSRHAVLRFRFNHAKQSLWYDTIPKVFELCFPQLSYVENKSDWFIELPNGSQIWLGGLDDKDRTEKILGNEYSTMYFNEISQISYSSLVIALTRLAQKTTLKNIAYFDCNPPSKQHWSYKIWFQGIHPENKESLANKDMYACMRMNPEGNKMNIADNFIENTLASLSGVAKSRFYLGEYSDEDLGLIFNNWRYGQFDESLQSAYGLDFGFQDPDAMTKVAIDRKNHIIYADELIYKTGNSSDQLRQLINFHVKGNGLIIADCADPRLINELRRYYNIKPVQKGKWTVSDALKMMQNYEIVITGRSKNIASELEMYSWHDEKSGIPIGEDHLLDGIRYVFMEFTDSLTRKMQRIN